MSCCARLPARRADCRRSGTLVARWLNPTRSRNARKPGGRVRLFGEVRGGFFGSRWCIPCAWWRVGEALPDALTPVYPTTAASAGSPLRKLIDWRAAERAARRALPADWLRCSAAAFRRGDARCTTPRAMPTLLGARGCASIPAWRAWFEELLVADVAARAYTLARPGPCRCRSRWRAHCAPLLASLPFPPDRRAGPGGGRSPLDPLRHPMQRLRRRRRQREDPGRRAGDAAGGRERLAGGDDGAHRDPRRAALAKLSEWLAPLGSVGWVGQPAEAKSRSSSPAWPRRAAARGRHPRADRGPGFRCCGWRWRWSTSSIASACASAWRCAQEGRGGAPPTMLMMSATPIPRTLAMSALRRPGCRCSTNCRRAHAVRHPFGRRRAPRRGGRTRPPACEGARPTGCAR